MTCITLSLRTPHGFRLIYMRPLFAVWPPAPAPIDETTASTDGSCSTN